MHGTRETVLQAIPTVREVESFGAAEIEVDDTREGLSNSLEQIGFDTRQSGQSQCSQRYDGGARCQIGADKLDALLVGTEAFVITVNGELL